MRKSWSRGLRISTFRSLPPHITIITHHYTTCHLTELKPTIRGKAYPYLPYSSACIPFYKEQPFPGPPVLTESLADDPHNLLSHQHCRFRGMGFAMYFSRFLNIFIWEREMPFMTNGGDKAHACRRESNHMIRKHLFLTRARWLKDSTGLRQNLWRVHTQR